MKLFTSIITAAVLLLPTFASAQTQLTVREIQRVPQSNLDQLQALGSNATSENVDNLIAYERDGESVQFTAVVLSDPYNSGLSGWDEDNNRPDRVHVFVRDTSVVSSGYEGMTTQLVDGSASVLQMQVGRVYTIVGTVGEFRNAVQISPSSFVDEGPYQTLGLPDEILDPVDVTTDDLNQVVGTTSTGGPLLQANWENFNDVNSQYVRFDEALVTASDQGSNGRPNYQWSSSDTDAAVNSSDTSLRFRNDKGDDGDYPNPPYNTRPQGDDFTAPAVGAVIEIQGFVTFGAFDFNE